MTTTIDIFGNGTTVRVITNGDSPSIPAPGDDLSIPSPWAAPVPGAFQQLTINNRIFRFDGPAAAPTLYVLLVTNNPIQ
jgi:hypothetical protein